jgi:hypothetical protein
MAARDLEEALALWSHSHWGHALELLLWIPHRTDDVVPALLKAWEQAHDDDQFIAALPYELLGERPPGWGREARAKRLMPLAYAMLSAGRWNNKIWHRILPSPGKGGDADELVRSILGEALLAIARDTTKSRDLRVGTLKAIARLGRGDLGSALATVDLPEAADAARALAKTTKGHPVDPGLGILDALEEFEKFRKKT